MIKYNPKNWLKLVLGIHKSDTLSILWKELIYFFVFTLTLCYVAATYFPGSVMLENLLTIYSIIGFVISLLLVFRTNTAYDRWWEGRKKWGEMVNDARNLAAKLSVLDLKDDERDFFNRMISNYVFAMRDHLREGVRMEELLLTDQEKVNLADREHVPSQLVKMMYAQVRRLVQEGRLSEENYITVEHTLNNFLNNIGACERIKNTPIPYSYSIFIKKFIFLYTASLPLALLEFFGYYTAIIATLVFYILVSMEVLAEEIEDPFGRDDNDLPTSELSLKIQQNVKELFY
ncbi:putative membrane protein [Lishizhenia tianjinensis]|uniref:Putative membrane protein n=1 Tax=Lishizhenia tianjinensis TaxID=477690 RepID=A0A1I6XCR0_9FLAO|nr:bestrophin family ion channel [Lishizhenia tianjinensis]SFT36075.1 putative membrane protein [Lishizhenia tianjinensis]